MTIVINDDEATLLNILLSKERAELTELIQKYKNIAFAPESELGGHLLARNISHINFLNRQTSTVDELISKINQASIFKD